MAGRREFCAGCRDDFYNTQNAAHGGCWSLKTATVVTRFRLAWWTAPTVPGAFTEVRTNSCHHRPGQFAFYEKLPTFAVEPHRIAKTTAAPRTKPRVEHVSSSPSTPTKVRAIRLRPVPIDDDDIPF